MTGLAGWLITLNLAQAQAPQPWPGLQIRPVPGGVDLLASPSGESPLGISGEWRLQRSSDLEQWEDVLRGPAATFLSADATLLHHAAADTPQMFWRLLPAATPSPIHGSLSWVLNRRQRITLTNSSSR